MRMIHSAAHYDLLVVVFVSTLSVSAYARTISKEVTVTSNPLLADPRPWCVGRFVIDRPSKTTMHTEKYEYWGYGIDTTLNVTSGTFKYRVQTREDELKNKKRTTSISSYREMLEKGLQSMIVETDIPWLEKSIAPTSNSRLLIFRKSADAHRLFTQEGYVLAGSTMLTFKTSFEPSDVDKSIHLASDVYRHITYRDNWSIPTETGFCVNGALIGGPSRNSELLSQFWTLPVPGVFGIEMRDAVDVDAQSSLLKDLPGLKRKLRDQGYDGHVKILRQGKRTVAGMPAEEVLFSIKGDGVQMFRFYLLAPGKPRDMSQPHTAIQMLLGDPPKEGWSTAAEATSPVDEAAAVQAWDSLLDSMRLRPGAL